MPQPVGQLAYVDLDLTARSVRRPAAADPRPVELSRALSTAEAQALDLAFGAAREDEPAAPADAPILGRHVDIRA